MDSPDCESRCPEMLTYYFLFPASKTQMPIDVYTGDMLDETTTPDELTMSDVCEQPGMIIPWDTLGDISRNADLVTSYMIAATCRRAAREYLPKETPSTPVDIKRLLWILGYAGVEVVEPSVSFHSLISGEPNDITIQARTPSEVLHNLIFFRAGIQHLCPKLVKSNSTLELHHAGATICVSADVISKIPWTPEEYYKVFEELFVASFAKVSITFSEEKDVHAVARLTPNYERALSIQDIHLALVGLIRSGTKNRKKILKRYPAQFPDRPNISKDYLRDSNYWKHVGIDWCIPSLLLRASELPEARRIMLLVEYLPTHLFEPFLKYYFPAGIPDNVNISNDSVSYFDWSKWAILKFYPRCTGVKKNTVTYFYDPGTL